MPRIGIGGAAGVGSVIYALVRSADLLEEPALLQDAVDAATLITVARIEADYSHDVVHGAAGAILGLLVLYQAQPERGVLERAIACGRRLVAQAKRPDAVADGRAWRTIGDRQFTGFSHGAAGIAYALLRLYQATGNKAFWAAACEGIAYETSVFSTEAGSWPEIPEPPERKFDQSYPCQWCHGATGIGLARLGGLDVREDRAIHKDIEVAINATVEVPIRTIDDLCCGNFGRLEFLFTAGKHLGRDELVAVALDRAAQLVAKAQESGTFQWRPGSKGHNSGFFTGMAGVGYELLRLTHPETLPSVLLWE